MTRNPMFSTLFMAACCMSCSGAQWPILPSQDATAAWGRGGCTCSHKAQHGAHGGVVRVQQQRAAAQRAQPSGEGCVGQGSMTCNQYVWYGMHGGVVHVLKQPAAASGGQPGRDGCISCRTLHACSGRAGPAARGSIRQES